MDDIDDTINLNEIFARIRRGYLQILGLSLLAAVAVILAQVILFPVSSTTTSTRIAFAFPGFEKGLYPDDTKFQPDDLRAPEVIQTALKELGLSTADEFQGKIRAAVTVEGLIPPDVAKERDRARAAGQPSPTYIPDEYAVTLTLPVGFPLTKVERVALLNKIVSAYHQSFQQTYLQLPQGFGNVFEALHKSDSWEYELLLSEEVQKVDNFLETQSEKAKAFRSRSTNLSFTDLRRQINLFAQVQLNHALGLIYANGLSGNRTLAQVKMNYYLHILENKEKAAMEEDAVVRDLLSKTQERAQNYILGVKNQTNASPSVVDKNVLDSFIAADSYNFLVRQALEAGLRVKRVQAEKYRLEERRKQMGAFQKLDSENQSAVNTEIVQALTELESAYNTIISNIRKTQLDFVRQQYADAVRISMQATSDSLYRKLATLGLMGAIVGFAGGLGFCLLGIYINPPSRRPSASG